MYQKLNKKAIMHVLKKYRTLHISVFQNLAPENLCLEIRDQFPETSETGLDPPLRALVLHVEI